MDAPCPVIYTAAEVLDDITVSPERCRCCRDKPSSFSRLGYSLVNTPLSEASMICATLAWLQSERILISLMRHSRALCLLTPAPTLRNFIATCLFVRTSTASFTLSKMIKRYTYLAYLPSPRVRKITYFLSKHVSGCLLSIDWPIVLVLGTPNNYSQCSLK